MKHAGADALTALGELLARLRTRPRLREKQPGIFYSKGRAFLHFHEDPAGLFADLRQDGNWLRLPVEGAEDWAALLEHVDRTLDRAA